jgi:hypothetical protein
LPLAKEERLWFCVYLPNLPLEACGPGDKDLAVIEEQQGVHRVLLASDHARAAGVLPGQSPNAALALLPTLTLEERSVIREQQVLELLATWLEQFSSFVCVAGPDVLLLEIAGSLRLFGGLKSLLRWRLRRRRSRQPGSHGGGGAPAFVNRPTSWRRFETCRCPASTGHRRYSSLLPAWVSRTLVIACVCPGKVSRDALA